MKSGRKICFAGVLYHSPGTFAGPFRDLPDSFQLFPFGAAQCAINIWSVNILAQGYFALVRFFDILIINNLNGNLI